MKTLLASILFFMAHTAYSSDTLFQKVWSDIDAESPINKAADLNYEAAKKELDISKRHWLPKLYTQMNAYHTNDPGKSFFGLIQQRSLEASDMNPSLINRPDAELYKQITLGVNLPLYEGGMSQAKVKMFGHMEQAQLLSKNKTRTELYYEVAKSYVMIGALNNKIQKLKASKAEVDSILRKYQFGSKSNPVGYSGLLGLKSLNIRIQGLINQYQTHSVALQEGLKEMGAKSDLSQLNDVSAKAFSKRFLISDLGALSQQASFEIESILEQVKASKVAASMESARYRPHIGAFLEGYVFDGDRDMADGYTAGVYLQWSLFNPTEWGLKQKAEMKADAYEQMADALQQKQNIEKSSAKKQLFTTEENLSLFAQAESVTFEQIRTMKKLFRNGSINALQMAEVLNRRIDILTQILQAEEAYLDAAGKMVRYSKFEPNQMVGVK